MKLTLFLSMLTVFQVWAAETYSQIAKITLNLENVRIADALREIEDQSEFYFLYSPKLIDVEKKVNISAEKEPIKNILTGIFGKDVKFIVYDRQIILTPVTKSELPSGLQQQKITGKVTDKSGAPLPGVSVVVKGTATGTTTGTDGSFTLTIPADAKILVFSFIGMNTQEVSIGNQVLFNIVLEEASLALDEVVVVGYGTQKKRDVTGAIATVKSEQIRQVALMSPENALQGLSTGVMVMQTNGAPGGGVQVQIRGVNSTSATGNQPLYVLDGVPLFDAGTEFTAGAGSAGSPNNNIGSPIATLNPADIESIEVLKDASAAAIYGARAANGVIVITTKSGKTGKTSYSFDLYYGIQEIQKKWDLTNATEGMMLRKEALLNTRSDFTRNIPAEFFNPFSFSTSPDYENTDWQDVLFRKAPMMEANLSANGGTEKVRYMVSLNYFDQNGIFVNTYMKRLANRINLDIKANDKLSFGVRSTVSRQDGNNVTDNNPFQGLVIGSIFQPQYQQDYNPDGTYWGPPNTNPTGIWDTRNYIFEAKEYIRDIARFRFNGNIFAEYEIVKGLKFKMMAGVDYNTVDQKFFNPAVPRGPAFTVAGADLGSGNPPTSRVYTYNAYNNNWVNELTLTYFKSFEGGHELTALLGFSAQSLTTKQFTLRGEGSVNPKLTLVGSRANNQNYFVLEDFATTGLVSQFARVNYAFKGKYLFTGTVRRDGSSNFGPKNRYGIFPSASLGWRISQENFLNDMKFLSELKLRASYGLTGNQNIGSFGYISKMSAASTIFGSTVANGYAPINIANEALKWESNEQTDFGLDLGLFKGRIGFTADYFIKNANDLLVNIPISTISGYSSQPVNLGTIQNKGYELSLTTYNMVNAFKWTTIINFSSVKNKVIDLGKNASGGVNEFFGYAPFTTSGPVNITKAGYPIGSFYGYQTNGIFKTYEETVGYPTQVGVVPLAGDYKYVDQNNDGVINDNDRVILGAPFPDFFGSIKNDFSYRNFTLSIFANYVYGMKMFNHTRLMLEDFGDAAGSVNQLKRFTAADPNTGYPRMTLGNVAGYNRLNSDRWIDDASYLRLRNITLGYDVPVSFLGMNKDRSLRIYVSVNNAYTFTKYVGWDPEVNSSGSNVLSAGIDQGGYPVARSYVMGINLKF